MRKYDHKRGFTLIELLVVVLIVGILAAIALPQYQKAVRNTRFVEMELGIDVAKKNIEQYLLINGMPGGPFGRGVMFTGNKRTGDIGMPGDCDNHGNTWCETDETGWAAQCAAGCHIQVHTHGWLKQGTAFNLYKDTIPGVWYYGGSREPHEALCQWLKKKKYPASVQDCTEFGITLDTYTP